MKQYINPAVEQFDVRPENIIALSMQEGTATGDDALVKEEREREEEQRQGRTYRTTTVEWEQWDQQ